MSSEPIRTRRGRRFFTLTGYGSAVAVVSLVVMISRCGQCERVFCT